MRSTKVTPFIIGAVAVLVLAQQNSSQTAGTTKRTVIAASILLDGNGGVLKNTRVAIEGSKIVAIDPKAGPVDYDLRGLTLLPGWIDAHVHIGWSFGADGKNLNEERRHQRPRLRIERLPMHGKD